MYLCNECKKTYSSMLLLNIHSWSKHPTNAIEIHWSMLYNSGELLNGKYTMEYQYNPYY